MNIGNLIFTLPAWHKTLVRKTEKENKKIANTESSLVYNIYIYMYKHQLSNIYCLVDNNFIAETHKNWQHVNIL